jgi:hypothetical protein
MGLRHKTCPLTGESTGGGRALQRLAKVGRFVGTMAYQGSILDKAVVAECDLDKLVRDARERSIPVAILVTREEAQLRQLDRECRWGQKDGVWILRTTRQWLPRDLDVLKPIFDRMRIQGFDFLEKNAALAEEVRRTFADIDRIESELKKAAKAITSASGLVTKYRGRMQELCDTAAAPRIAPKPQQDVGDNRRTAGA